MIGRHSSLKAVQELSPGASRNISSLKILHVTPWFYPALVYGGPAYSVYGLCQSLVRQGCQLRVLTTDANGPGSVLKVKTREDVEVSPGLFVRYCHRVTDVSVSPTLLRLLVSQVGWAHVIHLTAVYSFPTIPTLLACRMMGKPVVWSPRGMLQRWEGTSHRQLKEIWEKVCRVAAPKRLLLHVTSDEEARESKHRLPGVETALVPNGVDVPSRITCVQNDRHFQLAYVGRLHPKKGIENLLNAYNMVDDKLGVTSSLIIAGSGDAEYTESIKTQIGSLGLSQRVRMIGHVAGQAKTKLFECTDVVIVPSYTENFCLVVAEALAHGVPVIASRGTPWKRLEDIGCGLWVDNDPRTLAEAIKRISAMPRRDMGLRGREWMQMEFAWDSVAERMIHAYRKLLPNLQ